MRPYLVIVFNPFTHNNLSFFKAVEDLPIQKVVSEGAVKAFTKAILPRTTWRNVGSLDAYT
jgi:hypothetical protein